MAHEAAWLTADKQGLTGLLLQSHQRAFSRPLIASAQPGQPKRLLCQNLFACGFPVLAHGTEQDPSSVTPTLRPCSCGTATGMG